MSSVLTAREQDARSGLPVHQPTLLSAGREWGYGGGCWCTCRCGWTSLVYRTIVGAHLEFGRHLLDQGAVRP